MLDSDVTLSVSDFVAVCNQALDYTFPALTVVGEIANLKVSKNKWVYFDIKDDYASVRCFGTVYMLPGPVEDGMVVRVSAQPRLHEQFGFSLNIRTMLPVGEGSIRRAADLLQAKLTTEGLFDTDRKRPLPYPPERIGLITSRESAAFADFMKILGTRWGGVEILLHDVQVQGEAAPGQIIAALERFNQLADPPEVLVITRGGGSADDLAAFSVESVVRAVSASRIPTLVAVGHEVDVSLAELAADQRASTPSNAAEMLTPDRRHELAALSGVRRELYARAENILDDAVRHLQVSKTSMMQQVGQQLRDARLRLASTSALLGALNPQAILARGYILARKDGKVLRSANDVSANDIVELQFIDGQARARIEGE